MAEVHDRLSAPFPTFPGTGLMTYRIRFENQGETVIGTPDNDAVTTYRAELVVYHTYMGAPTMKPGSGIVINIPGIGTSRHSFEEHF